MERFGLHRGDWKHMDLVYLGIWPQRRENNKSHYECCYRRLDVTNTFVFDLINVINNLLHV